MQIHKRQLVDQVIGEIQHWISLGQYRPGDRLPTESQLTEQLGVSRTTVRESVRVLSHAGLLDVRQGDGTYIRPTPAPQEPLVQRLKRSTALEVYEVRAALERETARLAAARRSEADVATLQRHLAAREDARARGHHDELVEADVALHLAIAAAGKNAVLADLFRAFMSEARSTLSDLIGDPALPDTSGLHRELVDAIVRRDAAGAIKATDQILDADASVLRRLTP